MKHFYIITNEQKDEGLKVTRRMYEYICKRGGTCGYAQNRSPGSLSFDSQVIPKDTECVFCVGGDGTLIRAARDVVTRHVPVLGVNRGHIGYLCELDETNVFSAIDQLMAGAYTTEDRMLLSGYWESKGEIHTPHLALNDIVIHRSGLLQVVNVIIYVNGEYLNTYSADGIIIATPTGSTAYSMSAGGPIVDPKAKLILITPISPHALNSKSIVLGAEDEVVVEIGSRRVEEDEEAEVSFDGDLSFRLAVGDRIVIRRAQENMRFLRLSKLSFLEILRKKMQEYAR